MATKKELLAQGVARAVGAGRALALETVDFNDPNRPKTCLEVDFPILPINQIAQIEGNAGKPIYQMSKWWARRRSSVFRSLLLSAAMKAPEDSSQAGKAVWEAYYANHQKKATFGNLKVADIFMGGGTTLVEGARLGMQMRGIDLNPVAWFIVKQELAQVDRDEVTRLLADIEAEVKPQITPFFYCDGPGGEKGTWTHLPSGKVMGKSFDPLNLKPEDRRDYRYDGPEIIYSFWAKHGPCQVTGCGHRTPIMSSPVMAIKTLSVKAWEHTCASCGIEYQVEERHARMAPDAAFVVASTENPFSVLDPKRGAVCPKCGHASAFAKGAAVNKKIELSLLVHPEWLAGSPNTDPKGIPYGGSPQDDAAATQNWDTVRAKNMRLLEVRGALPDTITCPETGVVIETGKSGGTVPRKAHFACAKCGTIQSSLTTVKASGKAAPAAMYAIHGYSPSRKSAKASYSGRFFAVTDPAIARQYDAATAEWEERKEADLAPFWPRSELPYGFMTHILQGGVPNHGYTHWWTMFNPRQLLVLALLLKAISTLGDYKNSTREFVLGAFQQYLRNQNMFCFWDRDYDKLVPHFSNNNYHPKNTPVENSVFATLGRGNWTSCVEGILESLDWMKAPWEQVSKAALEKQAKELAGGILGKSEKVLTGDPVMPAVVFQGSSTELTEIKNGEIDLIITDPPFGGLVHYSELSDFFYVWLRLALKDNYPDEFGPEYTPKRMEAVSNRARNEDDADEYYKRLLTGCWKEAYRVLKPGGILAFTFHHSEDEPWVAVLESLFDAGFYLETAYPIRSDETKGEGSKPGTFGSQQIEYDIIHVCRKRMEDPKPVSWARMRREVLADVRQIEATLANHAKEGLPAADLQVIRRGKALEYFSRHYGKVLVEEDRALTVSQALVGINLLIEEETDAASDLPPTNAEPLTRQFLRIFRGKTKVERDQIQKFLRGTGVAPDEFDERGWSKEQAKWFHLVSAPDFAAQWKGRQRKNLTYDYDQAWFLIGACHEGSGINAADQLRNENFKPQPALKPLLEWFSRNGHDAKIRQAAVRAVTIYNAWADTNRDIVTKQLELFHEAA
jgi:adenine-specific DNA methylase